MIACPESVHDTGMATQAEKLTELQAELVTVKAALAKASSAQSVSVDGVSVSRANVNALMERRREIEKAIQRLLNGGRGMRIDMSGGPYS